jgi:hypothetical protein
LFLEPEIAVPMLNGMEHSPTLPWQLRSNAQTTLAEWRKHRLRPAEWPHKLIDAYIAAARDPQGKNHKKPAFSDFSEDPRVRTAIAQYLLAYPSDEVNRAAAADLLDLDPNDQAALAVMARFNKRSE